MDRLLWSFPAWLFFISLGRGSAPLCPVLALTNYLHLRGPGVGPLFIFQDGRPCQGPAYLRFCKPPYRQLAFRGSSQATAWELGLLLQPPREAFLTTLLRPWVAGRAKLIFCICVHWWTPSFRSLVESPSRYDSCYLIACSTWVPLDLGVVLWGSGFASAMSPILSELAIALLRGPSAWRGGSWLGCQDLPGMGAVFI